MMPSPNLVLAYHGCEKTNGQKIIQDAEQHLGHSENLYDWLGHGVYFWESDPQRALEWATRNLNAEEPFVVGAVIDLGLCLDLVEVEYLELVRETHRDLSSTFKHAGWKLPQNKKGFSADKDLVKRNLDCAVINYLHDLREDNGEASFDTVRSPFQEGHPLYDGSGFMARMHIQICVRNLESIKGYFHPR